MLLRRLPRHERPHKLDVIGAMLIVTASVSFMLAINLGGVRYPWTSPPILALFALAAAVGFLFVRRLLTAPEPLIPIAILRNRQVRFATGAHAFGWSSIVALNIFMPQYLQNVIGLTPTAAGLTLVIFMIALNISAGTSGYVLGRVMHYKMLPMTGLAVAICAILVLAWNVDRVSLIWFEVLLVVIGLGFGAMPGLTQVVVQNSVERHQLGISVGTMTFTRNLLATFMVAVFGAIVAGFAIRAAWHRRARRRADAGCRNGGGGLPAGVLRDRGDPDGGADLDHPDRGEAAAVGARRSKPMDAPTVAAKPLTHKDLRLFVIGAMLPVFMGAMDNTILASALPTIGRDLNDVHNLPWLITVFLLASTACMPLYGKIADIHGRRLALCVAIVIHFAGSLICALSPSMAVLIFGRVVQGIGAAGLTSIPVVVLGDVAAPKERGKYSAYFAIIYTTAGACGPALGGFLSDHVHWSAIFWLNIPLEIIALILVTRLLRRLPRYERPHRLDLIGAMLIVAASVSFMLALNLAGARYAWIVGADRRACSRRAVLIAALFVWRLLTAPEPLIPLAVLKHPIVRWATIANACGWSAIVGLNIFLPIYLQIVVGLSPTDAGLALIVLMVSLNIMRRNRRPGGRPRQALQGAADDRPGGGDRIGGPAGAVGGPADALLVPGAAVADRRGLRADAHDGLGNGAERGRAPPFRHRLRHHELLAQPVQHHPDRDPGRAGAGGDLLARTGQRRVGRRAAAGQRRSRRRVPASVLRGRRLPVHFLRRCCYDRAAAAAGRAIRPNLLASSFWREPWRTSRRSRPPSAAR